VTRLGITYLQNYGGSFSSFSSTGWTNQSWTSISSSGSTTTCNDHYNNRDFSTYSDAPAQACPTTYSGSSLYMMTWHTHNYRGGVGGEFGVYVR
jgi:hypothetical protein